MTRSLKWHAYRSTWSLLPLKNSSLPPFPDGLNFVHYDGKKGISQLCHTLKPVFGLKMFIKVRNLMGHLSPIHGLYKFEFLFIEWRISCPYTWKTWKYYCPLQWNFWGIGDLYLRKVRRGSLMIGFRETWNCQLHAGHQKFFPSILSHRGTCALHEYVRYWNVHPNAFI